MDSGDRSWLRRFFGIDKDEWLKVLLLSLAFAFIIVAYTLTNELKDSIFMGVVGRTYVPIAKMLAMFFLIPFIFIYSKMVDKMRRYQLLCTFAGIFGLLELVFAFFIGDPAVGLSNTQQSPYRVMGWLFYFFAESFTPFLVSVFWAFANSVNSPESARKNYGPMVFGSKVGGVFAAWFGWHLFGGMWWSGESMSNYILSNRVVLIVSSVCLLSALAVILVLIKKVPGYQLHGYEAAYKLEKERGKSSKAYTGIWAGIRMLFQYPYVLGIFGMVFFYEVANTVLGYMRLEVAQSNSHNPSEVVAYLYKIPFAYHWVGLFIALLGTGTLMRLLGERVCLLLIPVTSGALLFYLVFGDATSQIMIAAYVVLKGVNYAFGVPVRESLFIPTVKEIKFKSKAWIDTFGGKFAKSMGSSYNIFAESCVRIFGQAVFMPLTATFFSVLFGAWFLTAFGLGRRFDKAVKDNAVIGLKEGEA